MCYALIAAAGRSRRFGGGVPKQWATLCGGGNVLSRALDPFLRSARIHAVHVVIPADETPIGPICADRFAKAAAAKIRFHPVGGATRAATIANGLAAIPCADDDWILSHDAARPCLADAALSRLIAEVGDDEVGGILALPLTDALKQADGAGRRAIAGIDRAGKFLAQTPQMFRAGVLKKALAAGGDFADEAAAVGALGLRPRLIAGDPANIKITRPDDLRIAEAVLQTLNAADVS